MLLSKKFNLHFRRFEFKYLLSKRKASFIRTRISKLLETDPYAQNGTYKVNSLYFDSPNLKFYSQTEAGISKRLKVRKRFYNRDSENTFFEIKRKNNVVVTKDRYPINESNSDTAKEVRFLQLTHNLSAKVWVYYDREAWLSPIRPFRLTLDSNLEVAKANKFNQTPENSNFLYSDSVILEAKFTGTMPIWFASMIRSLSLKRVTFSKYRLAIENLLMLR